MESTRELLLKNVQKIVVKVGTSTLTKSDGQLNIDKIKKIVLELSNLSDKGYDVALVTSGAVGEEWVCLICLKDQKHCLKSKQCQL